MEKRCRKCYAIENVAENVMSWKNVAKNVMRWKNIAENVTRWKNVAENAMRWKNVAESHNNKLRCRKFNILAKSAKDPTCPINHCKILVINPTD